METKSTGLKIYSLDDIENTEESNQIAVFRCYFDFSKYKGQSVEKVIKEDWLFVIWCIRKIPNFILQPNALNLLIDVLLRESTYRVQYFQIIKNINEEKWKNYINLIEEEVKLFNFLQERKEQDEEEEYKLLERLNKNYQGRTDYSCPICDAGPEEGCHMSDPQGCPRAF